jgi:hypothetical protein
MNTTRRNDRAVRALRTVSEVNVADSADVSCGAATLTRRAVFLACVVCPAAAAYAASAANGVSANTVKCPRTTNTLPRHFNRVNTAIWVVTHPDGRLAILASDFRDDSASFGTVLASVRATDRIINPVCASSVALKTQMTEPIGPYPVLTSSKIRCLSITSTNRYRFVAPTLTFSPIRNRAHRQVGTRILVAQGSQRLLQASLVLARGGGISFARNGCFRNPPPTP